MTNTPRASLPELAAAQAQKHVTHNEALLELDALICCRILDRDLSADPASPADGDAYIVKATGSGAWIGQDGKIAYAVDGAWRFYAPFAGLTAYIADETEFLIYNGSSWVDLSTVLALENLPMLGVNTTADSTNKLAVKSAAILFDNIGNGVQTKLNKNAAGDTASFLYQTRYSGRAEIGLTGDDNFHFKVSPDGSTWYGAIAIDRASGNLYLNTTSAIDSTSYATTGTAQLQVNGTAVIGRSASWPVRSHGDGWQSLEFPPASSGGFGFNCYYNGSHIVYRRTDYAFRGLLDTSGNFIEYSAASGTAGATISFTESRRVTSGGHTLLKTTVDNGVLTVGGDVMPEADATRNVGSSSFRFANGFFGGYVRSGSYTVATLPSASTAGAGARAFVTDANATTFASTVAGGGSNKVPVTSDGTNWIIG